MFHDPIPPFGFWDLRSTISIFDFGTWNLEFGSWNFTLN
jgi:hypothetical protein